MVDNTLTVYGTTNLRIVDASIIPIHIGAHIQSTIYAIAEKVSACAESCGYSSLRIPDNFSVTRLRT